MVKVFRNIPELFTLSGAARKEGRAVQWEDLGLLKKAALVTSAQGQILWVGPDRDLKAKTLKALAPKSKVKEFKLDSGIVLPAFSECHTHMIFAGSRSEEFEMRMRGATYQEIAAQGGGILSTVKATRQASAAQLKKTAEDRLNRFIRQGVTTVEIKSGYGLDGPTEIKMLKVAKSLKGARIITTFLGLHALPTEFSGRADDYVEHVLNEILPQVVKQKLASRVDIFVEKGCFTLEQGQKLFAAAKKWGLEVTVHADQLSRTGISVAATQAGAVSVDHVIQLSDEDVTHLSKGKTTCVLLPAADFYLKMNYPPARALIDQGARVALATDFNPGTSPTQDLSLVGLLARLEMKMTLPEVISAYTLGAAYALGRAQQIGSLESGKQCDFVYLDGELKDLFYSLGHHPVRQVWSGGRCLYQAANPKNLKNS